MKRKLLLVAAVAIGTAYSAHAQVINFGEMVKAQQSDAELLLKEFMNPYMKAFSAGLGSGWYNTGKTHSIGRPDFTFTVSPVFIPGSDKTFDLHNLALQSVSYDPAKSITPTVAGSTDAVTPQLDVLATNPSNGQKVKVSSFKMPHGTGLGVLPVPTAQLGIGLPFSTDLIFRFIPTTTYQDASIGLIGVGFKHDIKQWIPGLSALPFDWSFLFGYTNFKAAYKLNVPSSTGQTYDNQELQLNVNSYSFSTIFSKKLPVITFYGALGYDVATTALKLNGTYPVARATDSNGNSVEANLTDPVNLSVNTSNGAKATAGFRLKLAVFTVHADYTFAKYPIASAGLGLSLGN